MDFRLKDPEDMTPEERLQRIVEILAEAAARSVLKKQSQEVGPVGPTVPESPAAPVLCPMKMGRVPFGQQRIGEGRAENPDEVIWIKRIRELAAEGYTSEGIAKRLNEEDRTRKRSGKWSRVAVWRILRCSEKGVLRNVS